MKVDLYTASAKPENRNKAGTNLGGEKNPDKNPDFQHVTHITVPQGEKVPEEFKGQCSFVRSYTLGDSPEHNEIRDAIDQEGYHSAEGPASSKDWNKEGGRQDQNLGQAQAAAGGSRDRGGKQNLGMGDNKPSSGQKIGSGSDYSSSPSRKK